MKTIDEVIQRSVQCVSLSIKGSCWARLGSDNPPTNAACSTLIGRYTTAVAGNFQAWLGLTHAFARHEFSKHVLADNLRCEFAGDHIGLLHEFAQLSCATPRVEDHEWVRPYLSFIEDGFRDVDSSGLRGLVVLAILENTSPIFIPVLAKAAKHNGCTKFAYTDVHGEADLKHSQDLVKALESEWGISYRDPDNILRETSRITVSMILSIFSDVEKEKK